MTKPRMVVRFRFDDGDEVVPFDEEFQKREREQIKQAGFIRGVEAKRAEEQARSTTARSKKQEKLAKKKAAVLAEVERLLGGHPDMLQKQVEEWIKTKFGVPPRTLQRWRKA